MNVEKAESVLQDIQTQLRQHLPNLQQKYRVRQLDIFGSFVRGEQTENSDIDILVEFAPNIHFGLLTFCQLENELEEAFEERMGTIHGELADLNAAAVELAAVIQAFFKEILE